jgi:CMP-N-acetylneuraminic acid synthetase
MSAAAWGLLPARGGSKSIPLKNLARFAGRPLIDYNVLAARAAGLERIVCNTDSPEIAARCRELGVEVYDRPAALGADDTPVLAVIEDWLASLADPPAIVCLLQPTSPFLLPEHVTATVAALRDHPEAGSAQTVVPCPHNHHAVNQRVVDDGIVGFRYPAERAAAYNKQRKAAHWLFGNLVAFRPAAVLAQRQVFATPSRAVPIPLHYGFDLDGPDDVQLGEALLAAGLVALPHL